MAEMRQGIKANTPESYEKLAESLTGQGTFFDKIALKRGLPRELLNREWPKPESIVTSKGSEYRYLSDGRTQRFKKATGEMNDPQDTLVFIPPWDLIAEEATKIYPEILSGVENETIFTEILLEFAQTKDKTIRLVDGQGKELSSNEDVEKAGQAFLLLLNKSDNTKNFYIPIGRRPVIGWNTFDTRKYTKPDGSTWRERHIGNSVAQIQYKS